MRITWDALLDRIEADPITHLGGFSPELLHAYFMGYEHALSFHEKGKIEGSPSLFQFGRWFAEHAYAGPQGFARFCSLLTQSEENALKLFFEFRKLSKKDLASLKEPPQDPSEMTMSLLEFLKLDVVRTRPVMYFGSDECVTRLWAMTKGYTDAEDDIGISNSADAQALKAFDEWISERFPFAQGANWGKLFHFLALCRNSKGYELFFDNFDLFLEGGSPKDHTKRFQKFLDEVVDSVVKDQQSKVPE